MMTTDQRLQLPTTSERPCPPCCSLTPGHGFDSYSLPHEPPEAFRYHGVTIGQVFDADGMEIATVQLDQEESVERVPGLDADGEPSAELIGPSRFGPVLIDVGEVSSLTPASARQLAAALLSAADDAEAYGAGERP